MQYVKSIGGSVSKTWNSINPATLSGAIDVIVIEQEDGTLACSPFHVRFGKFSLLRPYEKKVEFNVNGVKQEYAMKLGEGGEAFFVFETTDEIPASLQTSPLVSPADSPNHRSEENLLSSLQEPEFLDLDKTSDNVNKDKEAASAAIPVPLRGTRSTSDLGMIAPLSPPPDDSNAEMSPGDRSKKLDRTLSEGALSSKDSSVSDAGLMEDFHPSPHGTSSDISYDPSRVDRSQSPPPLSPEEAVSRALSLSKKLSVSKIPSHVNETGDLMLDMTGYKSNEDDALRAEVVARKILAEELEGNYDIGALIGADEHGNLWIYSSEEAKEAANHRATFNSLRSKPAVSDDTISDPGYHSEGDAGVTEPPLATRHTRAQSDIQPGFPTSRQSLTGDVAAWDPNRNYAKTLRLTSDQLKALNLKPGANTMSFSVNKAICTATMYMWSGSTPIVISDIDGTITKSDALGHVLNMIGRDWTHAGVAKLYTDIVNNGYNIMYLTSRSVGQADTTRAYLFGVCQDGYRLPKGPVIMSPDRTMAALRREVYLKKPEVFKMACLRDILGLFAGMENPFYAGFGNRLTDALSYRSVNIPSARIFTINSNAEVSLDLLSLNKYKSSYVSMRELVDHFFPPVKLLVQPGGEDFTDFTYWRDTPKNLEDFSATDSEEEAEDEGGEEEEEEEGEEEEEEEDGEEEGEEDEDEEVYSDAELSDEVDSDVDGSYGEELGASYISQGSENTNLADSMINSVINDQSVNSEDEDAGEDGGDAETDGSKLASPHLTHLSTV